MYSISLFERENDSLPKGGELSLEDLAALLATRTIRDDKGGACWSPAAYADGARRSKDSVESVSALVLDFDDGVEPAELEPSWGRFCYFIHSTHNNFTSKGGKEPVTRWRAIFPLAAPVAGVDWGECYESLALGIGRGLADPACSDASRIYYLPSCPSGMEDRAFSYAHAGSLLDSSTFPAAKQVNGGVAGGTATGDRPGDRYNRDVVWSDLLEAEGWTLYGLSRGQELWTRPGKSRGDGPSAMTQTDGRGAKSLFVFTTNAPPFEANTRYNAFAVFALLRHGGDFGAAAHVLGGESGSERGPEYATSPPGLSPEVEAEVRRLLKLHPVEQDRHIKAAAKDLGCRAEVLRGELRKRSAGTRPDGKQGRAVEFKIPEPWPAEVEPIGVLDDLVATFRRYLILPDYAAEALALWVVHTHLYECFAWSPKIGIRSPEKRCGKSRLLDCLGRLCAKPLPAGNASVSALFRVIEASRPTVLIDELDTFIGENEDLRGLLNLSSQRGATFLRSVGDEFEPRGFDVYAPVAYAMIGDPPGTVADRSILIRIERRRKGETVERFRAREIGPLFEGLARRVARLVLDRRGEIADTQPVFPEGLNDRAEDIWEPLLAVADVAAGRWPGLARRAAVALSGGADVDGESLGVQLLRDVRGAFGALGRDRVTSKELCEELAKDSDRPWSSLGNSRKPLDPSGLAKMLRAFGVKPHSVRIGDATPKGYELKDFEEAFARYLPPSEGATAQQGDAADVEGCWELRRTLRAVAWSRLSALGSATGGRKPATVSERRRTVWRWVLRRCGRIREARGTAMRSSPDAEVLLIMREVEASGLELFVRDGLVGCKPRPNEDLQRRIRANRDALYDALVGLPSPPEGAIYLEELRRIAPNLWGLVRLDDGRTGILWGVHARGVIVWTAPDMPLLTVHPGAVTVL